MSRKNELFKIIADAHEELRKLRESCDHKSCQMGNFGYERPPNIHWAVICNDCGHPVECLGVARYSVND